jgi:hypothetical protein
MGIVPDCHGDHVVAWEARWETMRGRALYVETMALVFFTEVGPSGSMVRDVNNVHCPERAGVVHFAGGGATCLPTMRDQEAGSGTRAAPPQSKTTSVPLVQEFRRRELWTTRGRDVVLLRGGRDELGCRQLGLK